MDKIPSILNKSFLRNSPKKKNNNDDIGGDATKIKSNILNKNFITLIFIKIKEYKKKYYLSYNYFVKNFLIIFFILFYIIFRIKENKAKITYKLNDKNMIKRIRIGIIIESLKNGGRERQTSLILHYFNKIKIFKLFLFTKTKKQKNEYMIDNNIERIIFNNNLTQLLIKNEIDICIYQSYSAKQIRILNNLKKIKTIIINRSCFLHWIYYKNYYFFRTVYRAYKDAKYIISLIPFENDYLFKKWGINSILMNNFLTYELNSIITSDLSSKIIIMIGRGNDKTKRFDLGIQAMKYIVENITDCEMKIISEVINIQHLYKLVYELNLKNYIKFVGYTPQPKKFYSNASLHIFPTLVESFGNVLTETLSFGIPNILVGLDYVSASSKGTVIIYDDSPISIAKEAIKILIDNNYRKKLGKEARNGMKKFNNKSLLKKWVKIILSIYKGDNYYDILRNQDKKINKENSLKIIKNQVKLLQIRINKFKNISIKDNENFTFMENLN